MTGRMLSREPRQGRRSGSFFVGFHLTFLIQHSAGLDGMPRRIYEYSTTSGWRPYNLISTIGSFMLALGVLLTVINVVPRRSRRARSPGPDPWKANTLEWFTPSPPPENNFDVIPRVRSVEPMKDIRRQIEQQTGVAAALRVRPAHGGGVSAHRELASRRVRAARAASARSSPTTSTLTKPQVQLLLLLTTITHDVRGRRPVARRSSLLTVLGG